MRFWTLVSAQNPLWRALGVGILLSALAGTAIYISIGPSSEPAGSEDTRLEGRTEGRVGTYTEQLRDSRFLLAYKSITGGETTLHLKTVNGRLEEPATLWLMTSPAARKEKETWTLDGPMDIDALEPASEAQMGHGKIVDTGPGLQWEQGVWTGLAPLDWEDLQGQGKGRWSLPAGWRRELDGRFVVENKTVHWEATEPGALRSLDAQSMWAGLGFKEGRMEEIDAQLEGGKLQAPAADLDATQTRWAGPIRFQRDDGWQGGAASGVAPRPAPGGGSVDFIDLKTFMAQRSLPAGSESIQSEGARWTPAGIRAEGDVVWDQPKDGLRLTLRSPRVLMREAAGADLPADLPIGEARAEGHPVLTWGTRSISSPRMDMRKDQRTWRIQAPALGRSEQGTFSAGAGKGSPARWEFEGPVQANSPMQGTLRGDRLVWEQETWTLTGRPATWNGLRERLSGPKVIRKAEVMAFPDGVGGSFAAPEGDVVIRADRGESRTGTVALFGRVDCQGQGWRLQGDQMTIHLDALNQIKTITAKGSVTLRGKINEGRGEYLELDLEKRTARWQGRVKGVTEVLP